MKLKSLKPYVITAGVAGLLFAGDALHATTFVSGAFQRASGYFAGTTQGVKRTWYDAKREDPKEVAERLKEAVVSLETALDDYHSEVQSGAFDVALEEIATYAGIMKDDARFAETSEGRAASLESVCSTDAFSELFHAYIQGGNLAFVDEQAEAYLHVLEQAVSEGKKSELLGRYATEAVDKGYLSEEERSQMFAVLAQSISPEKKVSTLTEAIADAPVDAQNTTVIQLVESLPDEQEYFIIDTVLARNNSGLADRVVSDAINYCSLGARENVVSSLWLTLERDAKMAIVGEDMYLTGSDFVNWIADAYQKE